MSNNINIIIICKTFRITTNCDQCGKFKSKVFCDTFNKLPYDLYNIILNKLYVLDRLSNLKLVYLKLKTIDIYIILII